MSGDRGRRASSSPAWARSPPLGNDVATHLGRPRRRPVRRPHASRRFDPSRLDLADRRRGPRLRRRRTSSTARTCGAPTATSSSAWSRRARRWTRPACRTASRASSPSGPASSSAPASAASGTLVDSISINAHARPRPDQPVLHPDGHRQRRRGPGRDQLRDDRPELRDGVRLRDRRPRHRRGVRRSIRRGDADMMLAGGTEAGIYEALVGGFAAMRALSTRNDDPEGASRPFDQGRDGFVIGEGAGVLVLEALEHAEARGAPILAELVGYGATADAVAHHAAGAGRRSARVRAARRALEKAGPRRRPTIDHVNAHATSTPGGRPGRARRRSGRSSATTRREVAITANKCDARATRSARPARSRPIATIQAIRDGCVPPTINLVDPDDGGRGPRPDAERGRAARRPRRRSSTRSGSAARTRRSSSGGGTHDRRATCSRPASRAAGPARVDAGDASLLGLIDRLAELLERVAT